MPETTGKFKKHFINNSYMEIYNEDQFPGQDKPYNSYQLKKYSKNIAAVIKPLGSFLVSEAIEIHSN